MYRRPNRKHGLKARLLGAGVSTGILAGAITLAGSVNIGATGMAHRTLEFERFYIPSAPIMPATPYVIEVAESASESSVERAVISLDGIGDLKVGALPEESSMHRLARKRNAIEIVSETAVAGMANRPTRTRRIPRSITLESDATSSLERLEAVKAEPVSARRHSAAVAVETIDSRQQRHAAATAVIQSGGVSVGEYNWEGFARAFVQYLKAHQTTPPPRIVQLMGLRASDLSTSVRLEVDDVEQEMFLSMKAEHELHVAILQSDQVFYFVDSYFEGLPQLFRHGAVFRTGDELTSIVTEELPVQSETLSYYYGIFLSWWEIERAKL